MKTITINEVNEPKKSRCFAIIDMLIDGISSIFLPFVNQLCACGILIGIVAILKTTDCLSIESDTYKILYAMANSLFYFLPILLAYTSAKKFGANPFTAVIIAGILLYPSLVEMLDKGKTLNFIGLTIYPVTYSASVIPIILAVGFLRYIERFFKKMLPEVVSDFLTPLFCIILISTLTLSALGPLGVRISEYLSMGYQSVYQTSPILAGLILGGIIQLMVIFGFHWCLIPLALNNINLNGFDTILAMMGPAVFAQAGSAFAVFFIARSKKFKFICFSAGISALFGITEPAMYGVNLPLKKPMIGVCLGGAVGGAMTGYFANSAMSFAFPGLVTLPVFMGVAFYGFLLAIITGFLIGFLFTLACQKKIKLAEVDQPELSNINN